MLITAKLRHFWYFTLYYISSVITEKDGMAIKRN